MELPNSGLKCASLSRNTIGRFYDVHNELGYGFLESIFEESLVVASRGSGLTEVEVGLLLNFGQRLQFGRLLFDHARKKIRGNRCESVAEVFA